MRINVTGKRENISKYTSSKMMKDKMYKLAKAVGMFGVATTITATIIAAGIGTYINSLMPITDAKVFTDWKGDYIICDVSGHGVTDYLSGKPFEDGYGNECEYGGGIYWKGTVDELTPGQKERLRAAGINYERAKRTQLPDIAGVPLESVLPKDVLAEVGNELSKEEVRMISENIGQYMLEYLKRDQYPTYTCFDHYEQYGDEEQQKKYPTLSIYQGIDEKGRKTGEVVVGYEAWYNIEETYTKYFFDITNNQLKSIYDKDGNIIYEWVESVRGKKNETDPVTKEKLDEKRLKHWKKRHPDYANDEFKPLFEEALEQEQPSVSVNDMGEVANEESSIGAMGEVYRHLTQAQMDREPGERG